MRKRNYSKSMCIGPIMPGGMLDVIIPPSTLAVILGAQGSISVGKLLIAGFIPGFILAGFHFIYIMIACYRNPTLAPMGEPVHSQTSLAMYSLRYLAPLLAIVIAIFGGMFTG